jgi:polyisoprenoid-binding protein YceI
MSSGGVRLLVLVAALVLGLPVWAAPARAEPARFRIEPEASELTFKATSRLVNADGRFHRFAGEVLADPKDLARARVSVTVEAASLDTGITRRDNHLRSADFFDVERFPAVTFEGLAVEPAGSPAVLRGRLTLRGVTREIRVSLELEVADGRMVARGQFTLNRSDYGMSYQSRLNPVGETVGVAFTFRATAVP